MRPRLTYANVMSTLAVFLVIGGGAAYAASHLGKNSVGTKQIKKNAVTGAKVKDQSLTGKDINLGKLGTVPTATHAATADSIPQAEATHVVGTSGNPPFENSAESFPTPLFGLNFPSVGFYKDAFGIVHLEGAVKMPTAAPAFILPPGYRPASGTVQVFEQTNEAPVFIIGSAVGSAPAGSVVPEKSVVLLSGITFRAGS